MRPAVERFGESRHDYEIFSALAARLGIEQEFTLDRSEMDWVQELYRVTRDSAAESGVELPVFEDFWAGDQIHLGDQLPDADFMLEKFRRDPDRHPLRTPSGKIEIFSAVVQGIFSQEFQKFLSQIHIIVKIIKSHLRFNHPKLCQVPRSI